MQELIQEDFWSLAILRPDYRIFLDPSLRTSLAPLWRHWCDHDSKRAHHTHAEQPPLPPQHHNTCVEKPTNLPAAPPSTTSHFCPLQNTLGPGDVLRFLLRPMMLLRLCWTSNLPPGTLCGTAGADTSQRDLEPGYNTPVPRIASTAWARRVSSRNISAPYKTHLGQGMF